MGLLVRQQLGAAFRIRLSDAGSCRSKPIAMTDTTVLSLDEDGKLQRGWVEQAELVGGERSRRLRRHRCTQRLGRSVATCTSHVIDGVEVDYCVGNPDANVVTEVPRVNVEFEFGAGIAFGF